MLIEPLFQHAASKGNDVAVIDDTGRYTFAQVAAMAAGLGQFLPHATAKDKVGVFLPTGVGFVASFYGTLIARKTVVPINFLLGEREIGHIITDSGIDTVLTAPPLMAKVANAGLNVIDLTQLPKPVARAGGRAAEDAPAPGQADDLAVLMYTSGTSGMPKGVMLTYGNLDSDTTSAIRHAKLDGHHKFLGILPLFHSDGHAGHAAGPGRAGVAGGVHGPVQPRGRAQGRQGARDQRHHGRAQHVRRHGQGEGRQARRLAERLRQHQRRRAAGRRRAGGVRGQVRLPDVRGLRPDRDDRPDRLQRARGPQGRQRRPGHPRRRGQVRRRRRPRPARRPDGRDPHAGPHDHAGLLPAARRDQGRPSRPTAGSRAATWATSTPTATCT